jgi:hypothetical protein
MSVSIPHFDTKLQASTGAKEEVKNSLAEYLFPETDFAITEIYSELYNP